MIPEYLQECLRLVGIRVSSITRQPDTCLEIGITDLLETHDKRWFLLHRKQLRNELLALLEELGPVGEITDKLEQNRKPIPLFKKPISQTKDSDEN
jgi:hypothetical protein